MQSRWRGLVILDYEVDFPAASRFEVALYGAGAAAFPRVVLGERASWGTHRRPGILDIPVAAYHRHLSAFSDLSMELDFICRLSRQFDVVCQRLDVLNQQMERQSANQTVKSVETVINQLVELMAFHVLNWAIPLERFRSVLTILLGNEQRADESLMHLFVSFRPAHLSDFAEAALAAAQRMRDGDWSAADTIDLFDLVDALQAPTPGGARFDDASALERFVRSLGLTRDADALEAMREARRRTSSELARLISKLYLKAGTDPARLRVVQAIVHLCRFAAEEEEQRRRLQGRTLQNLRRAAVPFDRVLPPGYEYTELEKTTPISYPWPTPASWARQTC